jgi:hypothetical protein
MTPDELRAAISWLEEQHESAPLPLKATISNTIDIGIERVERTALGLGQAVDFRVRHSPWRARLLIRQRNELPGPSSSEGATEETR